MSENSSVELKFMFIINRLLIMLLVYCILFDTNLQTHNKHELIWNLLCEYVVPWLFLFTINCKSCQIKNKLHIAFKYAVKQNIKSTDQVNPPALCRNN